MSEAPGPFAAELAELEPRWLAGWSRARATGGDARRALARDRPGLADLAALLSPAAAGTLPWLASRARAETAARCGRAVRLFAPLYLSNRCLSGCVYCGFARTLEVPRRTLTVAEVTDEAAVLFDRGLRRLLLVAGEHRVETSPDHLAECLRRLRPDTVDLAIETQTWHSDTYHRLVHAGLDGVVHYQETYDPEVYHRVHPVGWKRDYHRRLNAVEAAAAAGIGRVGLGVLVGLAPDWRADVLALAAHASHLSRRYPALRVTVSLPRLTPSAAGWRPRAALSDDEYVQVAAALRICLPAVGFVLSTRESPALRDRLLPVAVTDLSAASATAPGGYRDPAGAQRQFTVYDQRPVEEITAALHAAGRTPY